MAKNLKISLNESAVGQLLRSQEVADYLMGCAGSVAAAAGEGYDIMQGWDRVSVIVHTATDRARQDNLENNTLLRATDRQEG